MCWPLIVFATNTYDQLHDDLLFLFLLPLPLLHLLLQISSSGMF